MKDLKVFLLLFSCLLLGSSLSLILSPVLALHLPFEFFSKDIPSVSDELIFKKTFDLLDFLLTTLLGGGLYFTNFYFLKKSLHNSFASILLLFSFSVAIFLQTHFVEFSKTYMVVLALLAETLYIGLNLIKKPFLASFSALGDLEIPHMLGGLYNGIFLGFFLLLLLNQLLQIPLLSILVFLTCPLLFLLLLTFKTNVFEKFPAVLLFLSLLFPQNLTALTALWGITLLVWFGQYIFKKNLLNNSFFLKFLYPSLVIVLFSYNPNFFVGNFDTVEEGFLLGWVERFYQGQILYKDSFAFHPPYLPLSIFTFSKIFGHTVYSERLLLHIYQIVGALIYFFLLKKVLKNPLNIVLGMMLFLSLTSISVRNNIEIRVSLGLLSLLLLFNFFKSKKTIWLLLIGCALSLSFFTSIEVGLVAILSVFTALNIFEEERLFSKRRLQDNLTLLLGFTIASLPVLTYLVATGSLLALCEQLSFYITAFSKGYFNLPIERSVSLAYFHWHIFNQYISSYAFYWELTKLALVGGFSYYLLKFIKYRSNFQLEDKYLLSISIFGLLLTRTALGRSDIYHLLSAMVVALIVLLILMDKLKTYSFGLFALAWFMMLFYFFRPPVNSVFLENQLYKFQTYGKVLGDYNRYNSPSLSGILTGQEIDTQQADSLIDFIQKNTSADQSIFVYPWMPELYFYAERKNATSFDTPYAFFSPYHQDKMISELQKNKPKLIIYNPEMNFGDLTPKSLPKINQYILDNYKETSVFGQNRILLKKD